MPPADARRLTIRRRHCLPNLRRRAGIRIIVPSTVIRTVSSRVTATAMMERGRTGWRCLSQTPAEMAYAVSTAAANAKNGAAVDLWPRIEATTPICTAAAAVIAGQKSRGRNPLGSPPAAMTLSSRGISAGSLCSPRGAVRHCE